ncbi:MAG: S41 family peptidase [Ignavibacteriaceae bacterium]
MQIKRYSLIKILILYFIFAFLTAEAGLCQDNILKRDWKTIIDTTWGTGPTTERKLEIFDSVWSVIDHNYACFQNLNLNWDSVKNKYRPEIENGVSLGRFTAILNYMGMDLRETHTSFFNFDVNYNTVIKPGVPILISGWGIDNNFGAALWPLPDSSLLVIKAVPDHPLGLEPGDVVLGYDGVRWKILYKELLKVQLPFYYNNLWGSNDKAFTYTWLTGAGHNWHLFDTIDIKKYSGEILHLPTSLLENRKVSINNLPQLDFPGIPVNANEKDISWGIVDSTNIGYVYVWKWLADNISSRFYNALDSLINIYHVDGLILDFRKNTGGYVNRSDAGLSLLFNSAPPLLGLARRSSPSDHYNMSKSQSFFFYPDPATYFDRPIAVLSSPYSISASDFIIERLRHHPRVKLFGNTSSSAFASQERIGIDDWVINFANSNGYSEEIPDDFLTHKEIKVDYEVSFKPDDVRKGEDTIVKTAIEWIKNNITGISNNIVKVLNYKLYQNYPNPFNPTTTIRFSVPKTSFVTIKVYDILGREVETLINGEKLAGEYKVHFNAGNLPSGIYLCELRTNKYFEVKKMMVLR